MSYSRGSSVKCKAIQIHFHIVRRSNGTGGLTNAQVNTVFETMNNDFVDLAVTFVEEGRSFINSDYFHNSFDSDKFFELITVDFEPHRIDIYLLPETSGWGGRADGIPSSALVIDGDLAQTSVVSHEVGHCLGLYHTHSGRGCWDNANCPENIDGSNCTTCGDLVCDTPADPCLSGVVDGFCNYTGGGGFNPDADNIMSYTLPNCMENLTFGQMERIHTMIDNSSILQNVLTTFPISGPDYLCSTNTFTLQNAPTGSTVT